MDVAFVTRVGGHELGRVERPARKFQKPLAASPMNMQVCPQFWFDPIVLEKAKSFPCVSLMHGHRFESFRQAGDGVEAKVTNLASNEALTIRARYLVGCDGASSPIRESLGIRMLGSEKLSRSIHMFFRTPDLLGPLGCRPTNFFLLVDREGVWGSLRVMDPVGGLWRLMIDELPDDFDAAKLDFDAVLQRATGVPVKVQWLKSSLWTRRGVIAERYSEGPVFLAGDAVHQVSPSGGLGMNTGIADVVDLGWKLAARHHGWGGAALLDSYSRERQPAGTRVVRMTTEFYEGVSGVRGNLDAIGADTDEGQTLRVAMGKHLTEVTAREFRTLGLQLGYWYEQSPICVPDGTPPPSDNPHEYVPCARPGSRAPHVALEDGRSTLDCFGKGFTLLRIGADAPGADGLVRAAQSRGVPLNVVPLSHPAVATIYERKLVLVRSDGHVAWRGNTVPEDAQGLIDRIRGA